MSETVEGKAITVTFDGKRCIHARHCVLGAPGVFKANTPGTWIFPDTLDANRLAAVAEQCPSGAITYARKDGVAGEAAPPVNTMRVRENGPYAFSAAMTINGQPAGYRATLCRCGASQNKPYCDGSHKAAGFAATGEPASATSEALASRDGAVDIRTKPNGPLIVAGNVEICSGTGRTINRVTRTALCRCGQSANKPYCDNSHARAGFVAE